ncbi:MAG: hypothetical protein AAB815_01175 [Patescibacteria group bacterium]
MTQKTFIYICELRFKNGVTKHSTVINEEDLDWKQQLNDAQAYFSHRYRDDATLEIISAKDAYSAGVAYPELLKSWKEYLDYNYEKKDIKTATFLRRIRASNFPPWLLGLLEWDLDVEGNEKRFKDFVLEKSVNEKEQKKLLDVFNLAKEAHHGQFQMRPKDVKNGNTTLRHIPYLNHLVQIANLSFERKLSTNSIKTALLHDVIEDTKIKDGQLRARGIEEVVIDSVKHLSRDKNIETREQFLRRVSSLTGEVLILKCLDRFHNIIRSFGIKDQEYLNRYINESKMYYVPIFRREPLLTDISVLFDQLLVELDKHKKIVEVKI